MIMNVRFINVRTNNKSVFSFEKARSKIIANLICFFRCDFSRFERLANLIGDYIVLFVFSGEELILPFCKANSASSVR